MINEELKRYIKENIFPQYEKNDSGHAKDHIDYVIRRSLLFAETLEDINLEIVYVVAAFHDIGHYIDPENHEKVSSKILERDEYIKRYFSKEEISLIKEAIEDHRASLEGEPRSIYGKIVSSADRSTSLESSIMRTFSYRINNSPYLDIDLIIEESKEHMKNKYASKNAYASDKMYFKDIEYENMIVEMKELINNPEEFKKRYLKVNNIGDSDEYVQNVFEELSKNKKLSLDQLFSYTYNKLITEKSFEEVKNFLKQSNNINEIEYYLRGADRELRKKQEDKVEYEIEI